MCNHRWVRCENDEENKYLKLKGLKFFERLGKDSNYARFTYVFYCQYCGEYKTRTEVGMS